MNNEEIIAMLEALSRSLSLMQQIQKQLSDTIDYIQPLIEKASGNANQT